MKDAEKIALIDLDGTLADCEHAMRQKFLEG
jgi:hydroxymethylpyrimidine pyrophosphatase-like HAD family hydrolase